MESSNPVLNPKILDAAKSGSGAQTMTIQGTVNKTFILLALLVAAAIWTWSITFDPTTSPSMLKILMYGSMFAGLGVGLATSFKPNWSPVTAPLYAVIEGVFVGVISAFFEARYPGIVMQAVGLTFAVTFVMLMGYKAGFLQATPALRKGLTIAMGGLMLFYAVVMIAGLFHVAPPAFINGGGPIGIGFSLIVVGMASMSLILDFGMIEDCSKEGLDKYMEWYGAFALMVTLVWLYLEILRLLSKVNRRD